MAKSMRSKPRIKAKNVMRKKVFSKVADDRVRRLHEKSQKQLERQNQQRAEDEPVQANKGEETMELDEPEKKNQKISTSGWRDSRKQRYRRRKASKSKTLKF